MLVQCMNLKKLERYLRVNLLRLDPRLIKKEFTGPRGLTKFEKHWSNVIRKIADRYKKCVELQGDYVENNRAVVYIHFTFFVVSKTIFPILFYLPVY
jgi:hypothetical protein